jgi:hypothetical protein
MNFWSSCCLHPSVDLRRSVAQVVILEPTIVDQLWSVRLVLLVVLRKTMVSDNVWVVGLVAGLSSFFLLGQKVN